MSEVQPELQAPEAAETEEWSGPSQEEYQAMQEQIAALAPLAEIAQQLPAEGYQEPQPQAPTLDPFSDNFGQQLAEFVQQQLQPVNEFTMQAQLDESEERARDIINSAAQSAEYEIPEGGTDWIRARAEDYVPEAMQRHGAGPQAAEAAIQAAFNEYQSMLESYGKSYHEQQLNQLSTLGRAPSEPGAAGNGSTQQLATPEGGNEIDLVRGYFPPSQR